MELGKSSLVVISLLIVCFLDFARTQPPYTEEACDSRIYCQGELLHTIQMAHLYHDSKTFVDKPLKYDPEEVLANFDAFMKEHENKPSKEHILEFVDFNFEANSTEFEDWNPDDWKANPSFLEKIKDPALKDWANELHVFWFQLGRKISDDVRNHSNRYSMIYVENPVIVPGGRFKEFYYWDSYWIQEGLLLSEMNGTVKGMILNFVSMVEQLGFVPNGGRIYYQRSQPPFLIPMVKNYLDHTGDFPFLNDVLPVLDKEFDFWMKNRTVVVSHHSKDYMMARYNSNKRAPRPESYREDYELADDLPTPGEKEELYFNLHSGAESGFDFSSKWFMLPEGADIKDGLRYSKTRHIIPVELNALIYYNAKLMATFHNRTRNAEQVKYYENVAEEFKDAINEVLWDEKLGCWFDYDMAAKKLRTDFYPTSIVPLWAGVQKSDQTVQRVVDYLQDSGALAYPSGIPSSLIPSGQQWDFPNGWAPSQSLIIQALERTNNAKAKEIAFEFAQKWVRTNFLSFYQSTPNHMFEKYDVTVSGLPGGGGEYDVVVGFGWTNGVVLDFLNTYGDRMTAEEESSGSNQLSAFTPISIVALSVCALLGTIWG